jgi:hypothetical protein
MSKQTKTILDNEKQLSELERLYHSVETQIGFLLLNSADAAKTLPHESRIDAESFLELQKEKDDLNRSAQDIKDYYELQKESGTELAQLKKTLNAHNSQRQTLFEAFGSALTQGYSEEFAAFFADSYKTICLLQEKIQLCEESLSESQTGGTEAGLFAAIKTTFDRSSKKTSLTILRQKLSKANIAAGESAFRDIRLEHLYTDKKLPSHIENAYLLCADAEKENAALAEREQELETQIEDSVEFIKNAGISAGKALSSNTKILEIEKELNKKVIAERIILSRVGKRYADAALQKKPSAHKKSSGKKKSTGEKPQGAPAFFTDRNQLLERLALLQKDITVCKKNIERARREIEVAEINKSITALKTQVSVAAKKIEKITAEKTKIEADIEAFIQKLIGLQQVE